MANLEEKVRSGRFVITAEIVPPLSAAPTKLLAEAELLKGKVDAINVIGAAAQGIRNLLILKGDDPKGGDQPDAKPVFDLESGQLLALARDLRDKGELPSGRKVEPAPRFFLGAADVPRRPDEKWKAGPLLAKIEAGAGFAQTQFA